MKLNTLKRLILIFAFFAVPIRAVSLPKVSSTAPTPTPVEASAMAILATSPVTKLLPQTIGHPRITGEFLPEMTLKDARGNSHPLSALTRGQFTVLVFSKAENIRVESSSGYFRKIAPYVRELGYQIILITTENSDFIRTISERVQKGGMKSGIYIDEGRAGVIKMGLTMETDKNGPMINAIYLVSPDDQIVFHYASISDKIPFSGEVLVLAARVYKDAFTKAGE